MKTEMCEKLALKSCLGNKKRALPRARRRRALIFAESIATHNKELANGMATYERARQGTLNDKQVIEDGEDQLNAHGMKHNT